MRRRQPKRQLLPGVDIDMMSHYYDAELPGLIKSGQVPMSVVDEAVRRVLRLKFALGLFEHPYADGKEITAAVPEHRPLVLKAAEEAVVICRTRRPGWRGDPAIEQGCEEDRVDWTVGGRHRRDDGRVGIDEERARCDYGQGCAGAADEAGWWFVALCEGHRDQRGF